jgi:hypothetical protein
LRATKNVDVAIDGIVRPAVILARVLEVAAVAEAPALVPEAPVAGLAVVALAADSAAVAVPVVGLGLDRVDPEPVLICSGTAMAVVGRVVKSPRAIHCRRSK